MTEIVAEVEEIRCRWCGKKEVRLGFQTCPVCHRAQNRLLGWLQVWNAPSWLAVFVAAIAIYFSYQQIDLARQEANDARNERLAAEDAVAEAERAVDEARVARDQVQRALEEAGKARDDARDALIATEKAGADSQEALARLEAVSLDVKVSYKDAKSALREVTLVKTRVDMEAAKIQQLLIVQLGASARSMRHEIERDCSKMAPDRSHGARRDFETERSEFEQLREAKAKFRQGPDRAYRLICETALAQTTKQIEEIHLEMDAHERKGLDVTPARQPICYLARTLDHQYVFLGELTEFGEMYCPAINGGETSAKH